MNTNIDKKFALLALLAMIFASSCEDPEPPEPSAQIPDWRTYYNREVGIEFKYPYNLKLVANSLPADHLSVELLWVGSEAEVFKLETQDQRMPSEGFGSIMVGGKQGSQYDEEVDGRKVQFTKVQHKGRMLVFTGSGTTFDKILDTVKFIE